MGTSPRWGLPYPEGADQIADGDDTIHDLTTALDEFTKHEQASSTSATAPPGTWSAPAMRSAPTPTDRPPPPS
jgi:hypothetical protein